MYSDWMEDMPIIISSENKNLKCKKCISENTTYVIKCDRCGAFFKDTNYFTFYNLCEKCGKELLELLEFLNRYKEVVKDEKK